MNSEMKWFSEADIVRHAKSTYNLLRDQKLHNPDYQRFMRQYNRDWQSPITRQLAEMVWPQLTLDVSDKNTPLADGAYETAVATGKGLAQDFVGNLDDPPYDCILVSPYRRTKDTLAGIIDGFPALREIEVVEEERLREQDHGEATLYNDRNIYFALHHEQRLRYDKDGSYTFRWRDGESVPDVRERVRSLLNTLTRDYAGQRVLMVTHHLLILSLMANIGRWSEDDFRDHDNDPITKPANCGLFRYTCDPTAGRRGQGKLNLTVSNRIYY